MHETECAVPGVTFQVQTCDNYNTSRNFLTLSVEMAFAECSMLIDRNSTPILLDHMHS